MSEKTNETVGEAAVNERLTPLFNELLEYLREFIRRNEVTYDEYHQVVMFMHEVGQSGEMPLFMNLFLESTVDEVTYGDSPSSTTAIEGPYYVGGSPVLEPPYELPRRDDEPGEPLFFSGTVRGEDGSPLAGALIDMWQSDANGKYSDLPPGVPSHDPSLPEYNLRGKFHTDEEGRFEVRTILPGPYEIPKEGPTGRLYTALGLSTFRPAHLHFTVSHEGYRPLTTQLYIEGDEFLDTDAAGAVKGELLTNPVKHDDPDDYRQRGLDHPYFTIEYDFVLAQQKVAS